MIVGGPGTDGGPLFWAGCRNCSWRAWGVTETEALAAWGCRSPHSDTAEAAKPDDAVERVRLAVQEVLAICETYTLDRVGAHSRAFDRLRDAVADVTCSSQVAK